MKVVEVVRDRVTNHVGGTNQTLVHNKAAVQQNRVFVAQCRRLLLDRVHRFHAPPTDHLHVPLVFFVRVKGRFANYTFVGAASGGGRTEVKRRS